MVDVDSRGASTDGGGSSRGLVPLPKRVMVGSDDAPAITDPIATVGELIERAAHLVATLDHDVEGLKSDQEEERHRIEKRWEAQQTRAEQAMEQLATLRGVAERLAERKARPDLLATGLKRTSITSFPYDENTPFEELVEAVDREVKMAKGITGLIRLEGIGELVSAATRNVDRLLANADATKASLLAQTEDELTAERKEARASFEIGLQVLRRDLDLLNASVPLSARSWDDPGWEDRAPGAPERCLVRLGSYVHPRLRNTPIPAVIELPGGPGVLIEGGAHDARTIACIRSVVLRAIAACPPGGLALTIIDPKHSADELSALVRMIHKRAAEPTCEIAATEAEIDAALDAIVERLDGIEERALSGRFATLTECNTESGEVVEPWHLVVVIDHPAGLSDRATELLHGIAVRGPRLGVGVVVASDVVPAPAFGPDGKPRQRQPLPALETIASSDAEMTVDRGRAGRWTVELDTPPTEAEAAEIVKAATTRTAAVAGSGADAFGRLLRLLQPGGEQQPRLRDAIDRRDPATWWSGDATDGIGLPVARVSGLDAVVLTLDGNEAGAAMITGEDQVTIDAFLGQLVAGLALLYGPSEVQAVMLSVRGRSGFESFIDTQLPHARLIGVDTEGEFSVAVLEGLVAEMGRRVGPEGDTTTMPRLVVILSGFAELLQGKDRRSVRAVELVDVLLPRAHRCGIHLVLADTEVSDQLLADHPALDRCRSRVTLASAAAEAASESARSMLTTPRGDAPFRPIGLDPAEHERLLWEVRAKAQASGHLTSPQVYDGRTPARLDRSGIERLASHPDQRAQRLKPKFWLGDPTTLGGPVELLLRRTDGANLLIVTADEFGGRGMVLGAIATAALNHGQAMKLLVADFLPPETGFAETALALERTGAIQVARRRQFDKLVHEVQRTVNDRHTSAAFTEPPVLFLIAGLGRARDLDIDPDDADAVERHQLLEAIVHDGPEVGVHTVVWCEAPATLSRRLSKNELREFSYRAVGPLDPDVGRGITGSDAPGGLAPHQALLFDEDTGSATRFRPYRPPSPEWLSSLVGRLAAPTPRPRPPS